VFVEHVAALPQVAVSVIGGAFTVTGIVKCELALSVTVIVVLPIPVEATVKVGDVPEIVATAVLLEVAV
jgi:hypothetical protein